MMPPESVWYQGRDAIGRLLLEGLLMDQRRFLPTSANGQVAFGTYLRDDQTGRRTRSGPGNSRASAQISMYRGGRARS